MHKIDWYYYRKIILNNLVNNTIKSSNYDIPKNCAYYLISSDIYIIGYNVHTNYGIFEYPVFCPIRSRYFNKVKDELVKNCIHNTLYDCGLPIIACDKILKYLD
jgi:hypothetical protein